MRLTPEQRRAVEYENNLMLTACPGSGKTRAIVSKLMRVLRDVRDTPRRVACITYTNAAVFEIEARLRHQIQPGDEQYYDICTIHSFCLNHIFRPFCHLVEGYESGFKILTPDSEEFEEIIDAVWATHGRYDLGFKEYDEFSQLRVGANGEPVGGPLEFGALTEEVARDYWDAVQHRGLIDFANIIYRAYLLLTERPEILDYVSSRFAWVLVDEFQDTSDLQVEILLLLARRDRTRFFLVGDPFQSIFGFAGARPDLADDFAEQVGARTDFQLTGNFRSSRPIIEQANALFPRDPVMTPQGPWKDCPDVPACVHGTSAFAVIVERFLPSLKELGIPIGEAAILAPTWYSLFPLGRRLREHGVPIVGPGARPYRRNRDFAPLAEQICGYLMEPNPDAIPAIERSLFNTLLNATGRANFGIFSYGGRRIVFRLLGGAKALCDEHADGVAWLENAALAFTEILTSEELLAASEARILPASVEEMKADMRNNKVDLATLSIDALGIYASPRGALKLSSLHNAKGREFQGVAMIDLHEGKIPHSSLRTDEQLEEAKRLFYVGVTRAQRYLLYVTDDTGRRNGPTRFLRRDGGVGVI